MKDLNERAAMVATWHARAVGVPGRATRAMGRKLLEEAAEFFMDPTPSEAADVLVCVLNIAGRQGWDMEKALDDKLAELLARQDQAERDTLRLLCQPPRTVGYALWDGIDCGQNARPTAQLWKETNGGTRWGYSLDTGGGDDTMVLGFASEEDARAAAYADVRERMADDAADAAGGV